MYITYNKAILKKSNSHRLLLLKNDNLILCKEYILLCYKYFLLYTVSGYEIPHNLFPLSVDAIAVRACNMQQIGVVC